MTKRFIVDYEVGVLDTKTDEIICDCQNADEVVDFLNSIVDENEQLRKENEYLRNELKEVCNRDCDKCAEEWCDEIIDKYFEEKGDGV